MMYLFDYINDRGDNSSRLFFNDKCFDISLASSIFKIQTDTNEKNIDH